MHSLDLVYTINAPEMLVEQILTVRTSGDYDFDFVKMVHELEKLTRAELWSGERAHGGAGG